MPAFFTVLGFIGSAVGAIIAILQYNRARRADHRLDSVKTTLWEILDRSRNDESFLHILNSTLPDRIDMALGPNQWVNGQVMKAHTIASGLKRNIAVMIMSVHRPVTIEDIDVWMYRGNIKESEVQMFRALLP